MKLTITLMKQIGMAIYSPHPYDSQVWQGTDRSKKIQRHIGGLIIVGYAENPDGFYVSSIL